ncbi:MAG TPA: hypothetical protein VF230_08790, partial [Acidimicrobiales bacterium]
AVFTVAGCYSEDQEVPTMPSTMPLRVGDDLLASAKLAADATGRSAAQQIGYWAKLGRELERSGSVSVREIAEVLAGSRSYDDLDAKAQATVRAEWDARIEARRAELNLAEQFAAEGRSWVEARPDGTTVRHPAAGEQPPQRGRRATAATKAAQSRATSSSTGKAARAQKGQAVRGVAATGATKRTSSSKTTAAAKKSPVKKAAAKKASARSR